jgi:hypothetical protein
MKPLRSLAVLFAISMGLSCVNVGGAPSWPAPSFSQVLSAIAAPSEPDVDDGTIVKNLPVCISSAWSAGELGQTVLYRAKREGRTLKVGYFVYWTTERPWGNNALSYTVLPALFIDAFYSHLFFMFPGAKDLIHGPGDIEGARVTYEQNDQGAWVPVAAVADNGFHQEVELAPGDFVDAEGRVLLKTQVWSHQLGATGQHDGDAMTCFQGDSLSPMTEQIASAFRLGSPSDPRRAPPAWKLDAGGKVAALDR